jgi:hypothetical protein
MKRTCPFDDAKPRTPRSEARRREIQAAKTIEELLQLDDEEKFKQRLTERYGIAPGNQKFDQIMAIWREYQRGRP